MNNKSPAGSAGGATWLDGYATENPNSICNRVFPESREVVGARLHRELPHGADHEKIKWLLDFESQYPMHFRAVPAYAKADLSKMSAEELLAYANNGGSTPSISNIIPKARKP